MNKESSNSRPIDQVMRKAEAMGLDPQRVIRALESAVTRDHEHAPHSSLHPRRRRFARPS